MAQSPSGDTKDLHQLIEKSLSAAHTMAPLEWGISSLHRQPALTPIQSIQTYLSLLAKRVSMGKESRMATACFSVTA